MPPPSQAGLQSYMTTWLTPLEGGSGRIKLDKAGCLVPHSHLLDTSHKPEPRVQRLPKTCTPGSPAGTCQQQKPPGPMTRVRGSSCPMLSSLHVEESGLGCKREPYTHRASPNVESNSPKVLRGTFLKPGLQHWMRASSPLLTSGTHLPDSTTEGPAFPSPTRKLCP